MLGLKSVICVFGLRLDTCVFVCSYLLARETLRDGRGRGGRHTDLASPHQPHPAAPPRCTGPGRGTPPPRPLRTHRWAGPAAPLRPPLAPRAAPRLRLLSFSHPLFGVSVLFIYSNLNRPRLVSLSSPQSPDGIEVCNFIWTQAGYKRICVWLLTLNAGRRSSHGLTPRPSLSS